MKFLGQHFLKDPEIIKKIIRSLDLRAGDTVIEIGPGHGELTIPLAQACEKIGAKLIAIEKDEKLAVVLENKTTNTEIINDDILNFLHSTSSILHPVKFVGNLPYYITGHLLRLIGELKIKPELCIFMLQEEVAERICAEPPKMNRLAASIQIWAEPKIIAAVPRKYFSPPPKVDSAVIALQTKKDGGEERYYAAVRMLFAQPRKTVLNNLTSGKEKAARDKEEARKMLISLKIDPGARPQDLTIADITAISTLVDKI